MFKYRLKKIPRKKLIFWTTMILIFIISMGSIVGFYAAGNPFAGSSESGIEGDTVIVNDLSSDWNYYMGLNYTEVTNKQSLPGVNSDSTAALSSNKYNINTLVAVQINYNGADINDSSEKGYISSSEAQDKLTYYKYVPIVNGKVKIQLIDNPYAKRPTGKGFNGWVCDNTATTNTVSCNDMVFSYDDDYYLRYVTIDAPAADGNGDRKLVINLKASWTSADIINSVNDIGDFSGKTMKQIDKIPIYGLVDVYKKEYSFKENVTYYTYSKVAQNRPMNDCNNNSIQDNNSNNCAAPGGCDCYTIVNTDTTDYDENVDYYVFSYSAQEWNQYKGGWFGTYETVDYFDLAAESDFVVADTDEVIGQEPAIVGYDFAFNDGDYLVGYYYKVTGYNNTNKELYYNESGISCNVMSCGSIAYKLIQSSDTTINQWDSVTNEDGTVTINTDYSKYYYLVTRDTNIIDLANGTYNISNFSNKSVPFTITGSHDGSSSNVNLPVNETLSVGEDMVIENLNMYWTTFSASTSDSVSNGIQANYQNLKIGRTITTTRGYFTARAVVGASSSNVSDKHGYVMVEAGSYNVMRALMGGATNENVIFQMGCDYDRATNSDSNLTVAYQAVSSISGNHNSDTILPASEMIVKSGRIGSYMLDYTGSGIPGSYYMYGIYVGAHSDGDSTAFRTLKVEGGQIFSINGGPCIKNEYDGNVIGIYITGGMVQNVVGGAGVSKTEGNRIISVTGGTVVNAVAGGSNSYSGSSSPGPLISSTLVYIGGNATIGGTLEYADNSNTLYGVEETGSVFGAGLGNSNYNGRGVVKNSNVIVDGSATINGSVYGGGNYGATGGDTGKDCPQFNENTKTLVTLLGGNVKGSVYGGANRNGAGYSSSGGSITLTSNYYIAHVINRGDRTPRNTSYWHPDGSFSSSRKTCDSNFNGYSSVTRTCTYYTMVNSGSIYDANETYYIFDYDLEQFVVTTPSIYDPNAGNSVDIHTVTINMYGGTVEKSLYGGSNSQGTIVGSVYLNLYKGNVSTTSSAVYGGGMGASTTIKNNVVIKTNTNTDNDLLINELYGGSELGTVNKSGTTNITINGGIIKKVYGGGKGNNIVSPSTNGNITVNMNSGIVTNIFGGSNIRGVVSTDILVNVSGGTVDNVYGGSDGSNLSLSSGQSSEGIVGATNTKVNITGGKINTTIYGGGKSAVTSGTSIVNISGGEFASVDNNGYLVTGTTPAEVFGGGEEAKVNTTYVNILNGAKVYNVYAGSNKAGVVTKSNLNASSGEILCNSYGGGKIAEVTTANTYLKGTIYSYRLKEGETEYNTTCGSAFGGGANASVGTANIVLLDGSMLNVYGGSNEGGKVTKSNVFIRNGKTVNVFGGNNQGGSTVNSYVDLDTKLSFNIDVNNDGNNDTQIDTDGDGNNDLALSSSSKTTYNVSNVFGGSNGINASIDETTTTNLYSGVVTNDIFGGGNQAKVVGATYVNMYDGTVSNIYGGGNRSFVGDAVVNDLGAFISGGNTGSTYVNIINGTIKNNVYGSSNASFIYGTTTIKIGDDALDELGINDSTLRHIDIGGSVFAGSETNADKSTTYDDSYEGVTGPAGSGTGLIRIDGTSYIEDNASTLLIDGSIYGSGNNSKVVNGSNIYINNYGTKENPVTSISIQRAKNVYITDSHIELNGSVDRADPNSYRYSLIRLDKLYLLGSSSTNGTYLYLRNGSTYLKALSSGTMSGNTFTPQTVTDNNGNLVVGVSDNRIYMLAGKVLSVSDSDVPMYDTTTTKAGPVNGMAFLGMYTRESGKDFVRGIYDYNYGNGSIYDSSVTGSISKERYTFVYGLNLTNYTMEEQVKTHGFYTNVVDSNDEDAEAVDGSTLKYDYVGVTPANETTLYYKWLIGVEPLEIIVDLIADKYSESGAVNALISKEELQEIITNPDGSETKQEWRDAILTIESVDTTTFGATSADATTAFDGLLVDKSEIPTINTDDKNNDGVVDANNYFALSMGTTSSGWLDNYKTNFYDQDYILNEDSFCNAGTGNCTGNQIYLYDSTSKQRNLSFWLYHSKNLDFSYVKKDEDPSNMLISMHEVLINVEFRNPHGDPTSTDSVRQVTIVVNISLSDGELDKYGGIIAPGKKYEVFQGRPTTIASNGSFSIYQSLSLDLTKTIAGSATNEYWGVEKLYHPAKSVQVKNADGEVSTVQWSESYRYLASSYLFPVGTVITMVDLKNNEQYYYKVTEQNYVQKQNAFAGKNEYKYFLEEFIRMGSVTGNSLFDDDMREDASTKYYYHDDTHKLAIEEFIFNVDFSGANINVQNPDGDEHYLFLQLARGENNSEKVVISTNGSPRSEMVYTLMPNVDSKISTVGGYVQDDGTVTNSTTIYVGEDVDLELETSLEQYDETGNVLIGVSDTVFDDYKLGAKITIKRIKVDENNNPILDSEGNYVVEDLTNDLFGTVMEINGNVFYPQTDGSTRIELAGRITDVISNINIDFSNSDLTFGKYLLVVETFVSYDGLYYGDFQPTYNEYPFVLLDNQYGLDVHVSSSVQITHDVNSGEDANGDREIHYILETFNGLDSPNIKVSLQRRSYSSTYEYLYENIPIGNIIEKIRFEDSNDNIMLDSDACYSISTEGDCYMYTLGSIGNSKTNIDYDVFIKLKNGPTSDDLGVNKPNAKWKSGTYRVVFTLYDGDSEVGSIYEYLIIRSLNVDEIVIEGSGN